MGHEDNPMKQCTVKASSFDVKQKIFSLSFYTVIIFNSSIYMFFKLKSLLHYEFASVSAVAAFQGSV